MSAHILVVDDDADLAEMLGLTLSSECYTTTFAADGDSAIKAFHEERPDLILLDVMLPGIDGIEVCKIVREESGVPIIMLTARTDTEDVVRGLEAGADDYVVKPFDPAELKARMRARLREPQIDESAPIRIGDLRIDLTKHEVKRGSEMIRLTPLEFDLLVVLARNPQQTFSRDMLLEQVWGYIYKADTRLVNVHVQRLRSKIELDPDKPQLVLTVRGVGYRAGKLVN
ncbi:response regulator transcription factor [Canibacter sp. lx-72]|uniref:MtrAB system response regulator MtrA n=1 Tax=Canibacter zhuwentaonis TaxID=2837491 RepID=UPI001BDD6E2D|nr:MtrAB system response regulator MtrA [Canibacter zhuwentaonis]MBT1018595.1 response regulator transcription factor [Canibacter zhuwentaonis]MBT1035792.1 response regulator transcription factor [Canibacter zhuwentaonis]